jgi:hypothetical protein
MLTLIILSTLAAGIALGRAISEYLYRQRLVDEQADQEAKARVDARVAAIQSHITQERVGRAA